MSGDEGVPEQGLEKSLKMLLCRAYEPVECRDQFQNELLEKLKSRQRHRTSVRTVRRRKTIRLFGGVAAMAAAAAVVIMTLPVTGTGPGHTVVGIHHDTAIHETTDPEPLALNQVPTVSPVVLRIMDPAEVRTTPTDDWRAIASENEVRLAENMQLRAPNASRDGVGMWISTGALMSLEPGACIVNRKGRLMVEAGKAMVRVSRDAPALLVEVPEYQVRIRPGSDVVMTVAEGAEYASPPAPVVAVLSGEAQAESRNGASGQLLAGHEYDLYDTYVASIPGRRIGDMKERALRREDEAPLYYPYPGPLASTASNAGGNRMKAESLSCRVGDRFFEKRDGVWIDEDYTPDAETTKVPYMSREWYRLGNDHKELRKYLYYLRPLLIVKHGDSFLEVTAPEAK